MIMRRFGIAIIPIVLLLLVAGCSSSRKLDEMALQVNVLEQQNRAIEDKLIEMDSLNVTLLEALRTFKARTEFAEKAGDARLDEISSKVNDVLDRMERMQQSIAALQQGLVRAPAADSTSADSLGDSTVVVMTDARRLYNQAFKDMASGNFELAILGFNEYVKTFPTTDLTDDAQFWIGECYYRQQNYEAALDEYSKIETGYTDSDKLSMTLYKLGRCHEEAGNRTKARSYYQKTLEQFPESTSAELSKQKLDSLGGGG